MGDYLHRVEGILVLDNEGKRVFAKYFSPALDSRPKQAAFEKNVFNKTSNKRPSANAEKSEQQEKGTELKSLISLTRSAEKDAAGGSGGESGDILLMEHYTVLFRFEEELYFYVVGGGEENEVVLFQVLTCFYDAMCQLLKNSLDKKALLENYELMVLAVDEMIDDGIILEINAQSVFNEVAPHASRDGDSPLSALQSMAKIVKQNL